MNLTIEIIILFYMKSDGVKHFYEIGIDSQWDKLNSTPPQPKNLGASNLMNWTNRNMMYVYIKTYE